MALPFNPQSISSLILWLDASDPASLVTNGTSVIQWRDKSIFRNHTAFSSTTAPLLSSINSLSSVYFNSRSGTSQYFQGPLSTLYQSSFPGYQPYISTFFLFAVATMTSTTTRGVDRSFIQIGSNSTLVAGLILYQAKDIQSTIGQYSVAAGLADSNIRYVSSQVSSYNRPFQMMTSMIQNYTPRTQITLPTLMSLSINGEYPSVNFMDDITYNTNAIQYSIGGNLIGAASANTCWDGHIAEVLLYNPRVSTLSTITMNQIQQIQGYLAAKWGLQDDLMISHPYKARSVVLSSITSALVCDTVSTSKLFILPSTSTQMVWIQGKNNYFSTSVFANQGTLNFSNSFVQLNSKNQNAILVNNGPASSNWTLHSLFEGNMINVGYAPYTYFNKVSTIGSNVNAFGTSVATNSNGTYLAVGAPDSAIGASASAGALIMYAKNVASDTWQQVQVVSASDAAARDDFGTSVCMSYDANYLLIGAAGNKAGTAITDVGAAYMFKKSATSDLWNEVQKLLVSDAQLSMLTANTFQSAMNQDGSVIALSAKNYNTPTISDAGVVYMFKKDAITDSWSQVQQITLSFPTSRSFFGTSISMSADGSYLVVGASNYAFLGSNITGTSYLYGSAFVYKKNATSDVWDYLQGLQRKDVNQAKGFGKSVSISGNAQYIVSTADDTGCAYVFKKRTDTDYYEKVQYINTQITAFGYTSAINYDGSFLAVSAYTGATRGPVFLYKKQTNTDLWTQYSDSNFFSTAATSYGRSVAMDSNCMNFFVASGGTGGRILPYTQSTLGVVQASFSFLNVNTTTQPRTILLPAASSAPGEYFWIKDVTNNASNFPVSISTPSGTTLMGMYNGMFFYANNFCAQFQSDGINNYNLVNYYTGSYTQFSNSTNFIPFAVERGATSGRASTVVMTFNITSGTNTNLPSISVDRLSKNITLLGLPTPNVNNIYFKSYDNQTLLPFWMEQNEQTSAGSNFFYVRLPYVSCNYYTTYYLYWDSNYIAKPNGFSTFDFFDDFSSTVNSQPDPNKWRVDLKGTGTPVVTQNSDLFMTLQGVDSQNSSANIVTRYPIFGGRQGYLLSNGFQIRTQIFFTSATGVLLSLGARSTLQDVAGAQSDWSITTLAEGVTYYSSNVTAHYTFRTSDGIPATTNSSNIVTSFGPATGWQILIADGGNIRQNSLSNTAVVTGFTPTNTNNDLYLHLAQASKVGAPTGKLFVNYVAAYLSGDPLQPLWGNLNVPSINTL